MSRVFLMKWYHFSVEYFEDLRNVNHCEFLIMKKQESGKYLLENKLRTWSELRRERALLAGKEKGENKGDKDGETFKPNGTSKDSSKLDMAPSTIIPTTTSPSPAVVETRRRWGGCPNGCDHDKNFKIRQNLADLVKSDSSTSDTAAAPTANGSRREGAPEIDPSFCGSGESRSLASRRPAGKRFMALNADAEEPEEAGPHVDVAKAREGIVSSPDGTPSFISVEHRLRGHLKSPRDGLGDTHDSDDHPQHHRHHNYHHLLHVGRDGGGTYSGRNSVAASDADSSEDEQPGRRRLAAKPLRPNLGTVPGADGSSSRLQATGGSGPVSDEDRAVHNHIKRRDDRMGRGTRANRLGDAPHSSDGEHEADAEPDEPEESDAERAERGVHGSVY